MTSFVLCAVSRAVRVPGSGEFEADEHGWPIPFRMGADSALLVRIGEGGGSGSKWGRAVRGGAGNGEQRVWTLVIASVCVLALAGLIAWVALTPAKRRQREREDRRRRFVVENTDERLALNPEHTPAPSSGSGETSAWLGAAATGEVTRIEPGVTGRLVETPVGERIMTTPPFGLRESLLGVRGTRYFRSLSRHVPAWVVVCPKVRMDSIVSPKNPVKAMVRDALDWATWRRRVRLRSVDFLLCDSRTFRPLLAIVITRTGTANGVRSMFAVGGGQDRIPDEVFQAVGLPMVRVSGVFRKDWSMIRPYVDQAILPSVSEDAIDAAHGMNAMGLDAPELNGDLVELFDVAETEAEERVERSESRE